VVWFVAEETELLIRVIGSCPRKVNRHATGWVTRGRNRSRGSLNELWNKFGRGNAVLTDDDKTLRAHLLSLLEGRGAHVDFESAVAALPEKLRGKKPRGLPYTPWQQVEHMRIVQWDILEYIRNPNYRSPPWPHGYWPDTTPPTATAWDRSIRAFTRDRQALRRLVMDPATRLVVQIPRRQGGHTILREVLLVADHTAYHIGQLIVLRRLLKSWSE